ncbi:MAG TPA: hypothetical protein VIY52_18465 [Streptosporangiaceae bacterium]
MSGTAWFFTLGIIYLVLLFTLAVLSFRKGHWVLGLFGFIFPVLWVIGAILPGRRRRLNKRGGRYRERPHLTRWSLTQDG